MKKFALFLLLIAHYGAAVAASDDDPAPVDQIIKAIESKEDYEDYMEKIKIPYAYKPPAKDDAAQSSNAGIISVSTRDPKDINHQGALQAAGKQAASDPIVLPLLQSHPIESFEIKVKLLDKKF